LTFYFTNEIFKKLAEESKDVEVWNGNGILDRPDEPNDENTGVVGPPVQGILKKT